MSSPVNIDSLIFASVTADVCEVVRAYLQAISVVRADLQYRVDKTNSNRPALDFLKDIARYSPVLYAEATSEPNAYSADLPVPFAALSELTGRIIALKIPAENTATSTLSINDLEPIQIVKSGGVAISAGELVANKVSLFIYNGSFHLLNPETPTARSSVKKSDLYGFPARGTPLSIPRPSGAVMVNALMVCTEDDGGGYVEGYEVSLSSVVEDLGSSGRGPEFTVFATADAWKLARTKDWDGAGNVHIWNTSNGEMFTIDESKWKIRIDYL